ncbi:orotidine 5'-phosphate decarboxylase [candidate division WOR-3 bacterium]|nr:orotidine 5'-phosphate decarboxylase [candidate division WOR-3 bacterium]
MLDSRKRYLQIAFNYDAAQVSAILPSIPKSDRILIEAGTPYIKREGLNGIRYIRQLWKGIIVADLKTLDGGASEVRFAFGAGANAVTVLGGAPTETLNFFVDTCSKLRIYSMIDMLGVEDPLKVLLKLRTPPDVVVIHRGRDEESTRGKVIKYKQINKIRSKYNVFISAAGGIDLKEARSAIFNGADIVVANIVTPTDSWVGISSSSDVSKIAREFLSTIE